MYFGGKEPSSSPPFGIDPTESTCDCRVSIIDGVRTHLDLELILAAFMAPNRPNSEREPALGDIVLQNVVAGNTLLSVLPERSRANRIDRPWGPSSRGLLLPDSRTVSSRRGLQTRLCIIKTTTKMMAEATVREMIRGTDTLLSAPPDPLP